MKEIYRTHQLNLHKSNKKYKLDSNFYKIENNSRYIFIDTIENKKYLLKSSNPIKSEKYKCEKCFFYKYVLKETACEIGCYDYLTDSFHYLKEVPEYEKLFMEVK